MKPLSQMTRDERLLLLKVVCAFAWVDLEIKQGERNFIRRLVRRFALDAEDAAQVDAWLEVAPSPGSVDPARVPADHRQAFLEAARAVIYADGDVDTEEQLELEKLRAALGG